MKMSSRNQLFLLLRQHKADVRDVCSQLLHIMGSMVYTVRKKNDKCLQAKVRQRPAVFVGEAFNGRWSKCLEVGRSLLNGCSGEDLSFALGHDKEDFSFALDMTRDWKDNL